LLGAALVNERHRYNVPARTAVTLAVMISNVVFQDQIGRRRRLQLHMVDEQLRVNLDAALANYDAVSFTRQSDGLVIEPHGSSQWSHIGFHPGEEVHVEAVRRAPGQLRELWTALAAELLALLRCVRGRYVLQST
jgi:hypothetical protein